MSNPLPNNYHDLQDELDKYCTERAVSQEIHLLALQRIKFGQKNYGNDWHSWTLTKCLAEAKQEEADKLVYELFAHLLRQTGITT
jgi:hypothetical protein